MEEKNLVLLDLWAADEVVDAFTGSTRIFSYGTESQAVVQLTQAVEKHTAE